MYLVISTSLNPASRSRLVAREACDLLSRHEIECEWVDLQEVALPMCDATACYDDPKVHLMSEKIKHARGVLLASPVYNYDACASAKNLIELTGQAWQRTVVGFMCAAGGRGSYMSIMSIANSLMLDFRSFVIPQFVYVTEEHFAGDQISDEETRSRIEKLTRELVRVGDALFQPEEESTN